MKRHLPAVRRIVVKVGTTLLTVSPLPQADGMTEGGLNVPEIARLVRQIADQIRHKRQVVLVSSGAIGAGMDRMKLSRRPNRLEQLQGCAAIGQVELMHQYSEAFSACQMRCAQVLLTRDDFHHRARFDNVKQTLRTLLKWGVVPVVNENDTVSTDEIRFGDNDTLAAWVALLAEADLVVLLSHAAGLMTHPRRHPQVIPEVPEITPQILRLGRSVASGRTVGGMETKVRAAQILTTAGVGLIIADGGQPDVLDRILNGERIGTYFHPRTGSLASRHRWLAFSAPCAGVLVVDDGARRALVERHSSLLPAGITDLTGHFRSGQVVAIQNQQGQVIARGQTMLSSEQVAQVKGMRSAQVRHLISARHDEVVHRDRMVVMGS